MALNEVHADGRVIAPVTESVSPHSACPRPLRVAVVSRAELVSAGLGRLLGGHPDRVAVVDMTRQDGQLTEFDAALYDLTPLHDGPSGDLARLLTSRRPVVGLEPPARPDVAAHALTMGVSDVVPMTITGEDLISALERVVSGQRVCADELHRSRREELMRLHGLSERELDILELVGSGVSNNEIAADLYLSINSIKSYIRSAYRKIDVSSRSQAVLWAVQHAVPTPDHPED